MSGGLTSNGLIAFVTTPRMMRVVRPSIPTSTLRNAARPPSPFRTCPSLVHGAVYLLHQRKVLGFVETWCLAE